MINGFAYHKIVFDKDLKPVDYVFLEVNDAFERLTGLKKEGLIGKRVTRVLPGIEKDPVDWIGIYGKVAITGEPVGFENWSEQLKRWYSVIAYSTSKNRFATVFEDVTERKMAEQALQQRSNELEAARAEAENGRRRLEAVMEALPVGVAVTDALAL